MSYVPDYVRPVCQQTSALQADTGISLPGKGSSRKTTTSTTSSHATASRHLVSPGEGTRRRSSQMTNYVPSRTWCAPQDRLCGRLSIKDRLKSLESDADVKLSQVTSPSPKTKKWIARRDSSMTPSTPSPSNSIIASEQKSTAMLTRATSLNFSSGNEDSSFDGSIICASSGNKEEDQFHDILVCSASAPASTPDMIESHKPKDLDLRDDEILRTTQKFQRDISKGVQKDGFVVLPNAEKEIAAGKGDRRLDCTSYNRGTRQTNNKTNVNHDDDDTDICMLKNGCLNNEAKGLSKQCKQREECGSKMHKSSSLPHLDFPPSEEYQDDRPGHIRISSDLINNSNEKVSEKHAPNGKKVGRSFSLLWKPPRQEIMSRLDAGHLRLDAGPLHVMKGDAKETDIRKGTIESQSLVSQEFLAHKTRIEDKRDGLKNFERSVVAKSGEGSAPVMLNVKTATATVPVELRSPRSEHSSQGSGRLGLQGKRNARVFVVPSSDSDSDNPFTHFTKNVWGGPGALGTPDFMLSAGNVGLPMKHVSPVKFVPSVLKRDGTSTRFSGAADNQFQAVDDLYPELSRARAKKRHSNLDKSGTNVVGGEENELPRQRNNKNFDHRRKTTRSVKRGESRSKSSDTRPSKDYKRKNSEPRHRSNSVLGVGRPSPRQEAVAHAVKYGNTEDSTIPFIDEASSPSREPCDETFIPNEIEGCFVPQRLPLGVRLHGGTGDEHISPRRVSYMEAMESSGNITPDMEESPMFMLQRSRSGRARVMNMEVPPVKLFRSNSADSVLSVITNGKTSETKVLRRVSSLSADRSIAKKTHRRSYQIATRPSASDANGFSTPKRQPSIRKLKNFFGESTPQIVDAAEEAVGRKGRRNVDSTVVLILDDPQTGVSQSGYLYFKVATIEKGKRTSSQKSWKLVWAVLKEQQLYLCKDWHRSKNNQAQLSPVATRLLLEEEQPLSVRSSLVGIAYNYVKRRNVFRLTTFNGSEYLFQAESRDDMLAWIAAMQEESVCHEDGIETVNEDLILKKTSQIELGPKSDKRANRKRSPKPNRRNNLQVKDVDGSRRFKWRGSVNKIVKKFGAGQPFMPGGTFGVHLEDCPMSPVYEFVPFVVALCCRIIEERGLSFTGIYRVPGNSAALSSLQDDFNMLGVEAIEPQDDRVKDVNVVSSLLKSFFRKLPDPLFTNELYDDFIQGNRRPTPHERLSSLRRLVHMLPGPHYETLKFLIAHLRRVADNCQENKMEVRNLAIVFGPTLVRSTASNNMATMVTDMSDQCRIVESIIEHATWFFLDTESHIVHHAPWTVPVDSSHEPVPSIGFLLDNVGRKPGDTSGNTSDSSKSKCSNESEKDSFSRDVIDLLFGKKWKQMGGRPRAQTDSVNGVDDHGGFEDPQRKTSWVAVSENSGTKSLKPTSRPEKSRPTGVTFPEGSVQIRVADAAKAVSTEGVVDVSKRLYEFYQEHLDRLSKTNIGQPLPTFSSTESSPQITPKNSSDDSLALFKARPMKHSSNHKPPDPSRGSGSLGQYPHVALSHRRPEFPSRGDAMDVDRTTMPVNKESAGAGYEMPGSSTENELWSRNVNRETLAGQQEDFVASSVGEVGTFTRSMDSSACESSNNIQLPKTDTSVLKPIAVAPPDAVPRAPSKKVGPGRSSERSIPEKFPSTRKTAQELYEEKRSQRQQQKRRMVRDKHQSRNPTPDENTFSRCDPKRRVIRSSSGELDPLRSVMNKVNSPPREDSGRTLSAMERLFNSNNQPQHVHIKSIKPHRKSSVTRRHTLSGILDFTAYGYKTQIEGSEKPNPHAGPGLNLGGGHNGGAANSASLYDLSSSCEQAEDGGHILSAMDRLKPRGVTSDLTLENWLVQERRKNKITKRELTSSWNQRGTISSKKSYV